LKLFKLTYTNVAFHDAAGKVSSFLTTDPRLQVLDGHPGGRALFVEVVKYTLWYIW
jgi:hypothetical protein